MISLPATVVMHRSPLKRIGDRRARPTEAPIVDLGCNEEGHRIWNLVRQCAEGCNAIGGEA